ncbi:MAG: response regulator [Bacteroidia bacterium]|nr:response regulator [Bacteroidia bacterium]
MKHIEILLVEDNPGDVRLTREALKESKIANNLHVATDGDQALQYLKKNGKFADAITPDLILLDLNLPKKSGMEVLAEIKAHEKLMVIPVVVLTTSQSEKDILESYKHHVNCYVSKPVSFDSFIEVVKSIEDFWFTLVKLPKIK